MNDKQTTIVHISDPHFGTEDNIIVNVLADEINSIAPDLVVISGDLTQRALNSQFNKAKLFFEKLDSPKIVIPGNHDIPLYNLFKRYLSPFDKFRQFFGNVDYPEYKNDNLAIVGVNTSTPFRSQSGRIRDEDIAYLKKYFAIIEPPITKGVIVHHNVIPYEGLKGNSVLGNNDVFLEEMNSVGVDLIFAGHLHKSIIKNYNNTLLLQAGTCISKRLRQEDNTYLIIETSSEKITISSKAYNGSQFTEVNQNSYKRFHS